MCSGVWFYGWLRLWIVIFGLGLLFGCFDGGLFVW